LEGSSEGSSEGSLEALSQLPEIECTY
jgi:hypothetical protein